MKMWLMYDISDTRKRTRLRKLCRDFGLIPVQRSVFVGIVDDSRTELFFEKAEGIMDTETDSLIIVPATDRGIRNSITFGCGFDKKLALREYNVIVI